MFGLFKRRNAISEDGVTLTIAGPGKLVYEEGPNEFVVRVVEANGYAIFIEEMGDEDLILSCKSPEERRRIAISIRKLLATRGILADVYEGVRPESSKHTHSGGEDPLGS
jgi:hypothetical protein